MKTKIIYAAAIIAALLTVGYIYITGRDETRRLNDVLAVSSGKPSAPTPIITLAEYQQLQIGMSYSAATTVIGQGGEEMSRNKIDGIPGVMAPVETIMYQWANPDGSNMNAIFQNDKLFQKAQFGLK